MKLLKFLDYKHDDIHIKCMTVLLFKKTFDERAEIVIGVAALEKRKEKSRGGLQNKSK